MAKLPKGPANAPGIEDEVEIDVGGGVNVGDGVGEGVGNAVTEGDGNAVGVGVAVGKALSFCEEDLAT
jgi:hypothetical protein